MSLFDRIVGSLTEAKNGGTFTPMPGTDAFIHTDRWRSGRRNQSPATWFFDKGNRRFPVWQSAASRAGTLRAAERYHGKGFAAKVGKLIQQKYGGCPSSVQGCPPKRNHGKGGAREDKTPCVGSACNVTKTTPDHGGKYPWPFNYKGSKKWDKDWTALGHEKGSQKGSAKQIAKAAAAKKAQRQISAQKTAAAKEQLKKTKFGAIHAAKFGMKKALDAIKKFGSKLTGKKPKNEDEPGPDGRRDLLPLLSME